MMDGRQRGASKGMEMDGTLIAAATFLVNAALVLVGGGIAFARQENRMQSMVVQAQKGIDDKIENTLLRSGETMQAIRQKITEVELFMRDNYVTNDAFYHGIGGLSTSVKNLNDSLDGRLIRMEGKIDEGRKSQRDSGGT